VKTTLELPDELVREIKVRAARENRKLKDLVAELLAQALDEKPRGEIRNRVRLPLFEGGHHAAPGEEMTPEQVAEILLEQDVEFYRQSLG
jgi:hypothetical protein